MKKLKTIVYILIFLFTAFLFSSIAYADKVVYILSNVNFPEQRLVDILKDMNFTVDKVDNDDINTVNWSQYTFMLVNDKEDRFSNYNEIPVNEFPALVLNSRHIDEWHWTSMLSQKSSNQPLKAHVNDPKHFITYGFPSSVRIYNSYIPPVNYLHRYYKAPRLKTIVSTDNSTFLNTFNAIIATASPGTQLRDGYYSNTKSVFFGISKVEYWTNYSEQLFRNSVLWLVTDLIPPTIAGLSVINITNSSAVITWQTDKDATSVILYGTNLSLSKSNNIPKQNHEFLLDNLNEKTTYYYKIKVCNKNNYCSESALYNFTTLDLTAPYLISIVIENITNSSAKISTEVNENGYSKIYYGTNEEVLDQETSQSLFGKIFDFEINNLNEKTVYYYLVNVCDDSNNCRNSSVLNFTTLDLTVPNAPQNLILEVINLNNNIRIRWDNALDDAVNYNIYISNDPYNFDFLNPNITTSLNEYVDSSASSENQRYYVIRAEDAAGNEENNNNIVGKFDLALDTGYNLVSLPLVPFTNDINGIMHQSILFNPISEIKRFNNLNQEFETTTYTVIGWNPFSFQELSYGKGYFFKSKQAISFTLVGTLPTPIVVDIKQGMNLFGLASLENKNITDVIVQTPADYNVTELGKRNADGTYGLATYYSSGWYNIFVLNPGIGYWLKANKNFSLTLNP